MLLVTGGAGYIGSHFVKTYLVQNPKSEVVVVDSLVEGHTRALNIPGDDAVKRIHLLEADISDTTSIAQAIEKYSVDAVVHFAGFCYVGESEEDPAKYFDNNVGGSLKLFKVMDAMDVKKIVFSSSCATYGTPQTTPMDESHPQSPVSVYGLTKYLVEQALTAYCRTKGWSSICLRYFNAAGADESGLIGESHNPETHLIPRLLQAAKGELSHVDVFGDDYETADGTCIRDYVHVNDLADAHCRALEALDHTKGAEAINLGTADGASVKQVIDVCKQVTQKEIQVKMSPRRAGDVDALVADNRKAEKVLGWKPKYDLQTIVETAWRWEQNRRY